MSVVRNSEVAVPRRFCLHCFNGNVNRCFALCPLFRGCSLLGGSVSRGSTVVDCCDVEVVVEDWVLATAC